jgi:glutamate racemase
MKIGIFDSGFGGKLALEKCQVLLPQHEFIGFFDHKNAPYGDRSAEEIYGLTLAGVNHLFSQDCTLVLLACNTASARALRKIQETYPTKKLLGCLIPAIEEALEVRIEPPTELRKIGIIATRHTVRTKKYQREAFKINPRAKVYPIATPKLVPWIETGEAESLACRNYLIQKIQSLIDQHQIDTLILGCTHYSALQNIVKDIFPHLLIIDSAEAQSLKLKDYLQRHAELQ